MKPGSLAPEPGSVPTVPTTSSQILPSHGSIWDHVNSSPYTFPLTELSRFLSLEIQLEYIHYFTKGQKQVMEQTVGI